MSRYDVAVVGSGPGGAVTALECARRGLRVVVLEEGARVMPGEVRPYSLDQMRAQYRGSGMTVALGRPPVAYTEASCVGGGSEVNSGLYHRPDPGVLAEWRRDYCVEALEPSDLLPWHEQVERRLAVSSPAASSPASQVLARGAAALGWAGLDVPRWVREGPGGAEKQTMLRTYLADAEAAGAEIRPRCRVRRLDVRRGRVETVVTDQGPVHADQVVVAAGAIHTPALLQRSGVRRHVGAGLSVHPTVKALAQLDEPVNDPDDLATYQVKEFAPALTLGGSAARPGMIALALSGTWERDRELVRRWRQQTVSYASIRSRGRGRVRAIRGLDDPLVTYRLTREDLSALRSGLARLVELLLAAGAELVVPSYPGAPRVQRRTEVAAAAAGCVAGRATVMTVHLCGTVPMGEDPRRCAVDSFGRVPGVANLRVNDASLLPSAPGVNPQGTVMAVAHRNVHAMLEGAR